MSKQLGIFQNLESQEIVHKISILKLFVDGAARNNPGPAAAGIYIEKDKHPVFSQGYYLGIKTNNQAEYLALIIGIFYAKKYLKYGDLLEIISDSELIVRQINGIYKIKNLELIKFNDLAKSLLSQINYTIKHVLREQNTIADKNANKGLDEKLPLPAELQKFLEENEINI